MSKWGDYGKEDYDGEIREKRKNMEDHARKIRQDCDDQNKKTREAYEDFQRLHK
jgi:uncharacterized coiled-coil DUF342 family protein